MFEGTRWGHSGQPAAATDATDAICFPQFLCELHSRLQARPMVAVVVGVTKGWGCCSSWSWAAPACPSHHPQAQPSPCPAASGKERALSTSYFPVGLYFSFHHLLTLDMEIKAGVHRAEKVLSIFFPSCRHQKRIVGSITFYITTGFDPLSIRNINLPLSFSVWVSILSCVLNFLRRKCKWVYKLVVYRFLSW